MSNEKVINEEATNVATIGADDLTRLVQKYKKDNQNTEELKRKISEQLKEVWRYLCISFYKRDKYHPREVFYPLDKQMAYILEEYFKKLGFSVRVGTLGLIFKEYILIFNTNYSCNEEIIEKYTFKLINENLYHNVLHRARINRTPCGRIGIDLSRFPELLVAKVEYEINKEKEEEEFKLYKMFCRCTNRMRRTR